MLLCQCFSPAAFYCHDSTEEQQGDNKEGVKELPLAMFPKKMGKEMEGEMER